MTTTYTVRDHEEVTRGLTAVEAADILLTQDGHEYEIRPEEDGVGYRLWNTAFSRNSTAYNGLRKTVIYSLAQALEQAEAEIAEKVILSGHWESDEVICMRDARYVEMETEIAADAE